LPIALCVEASGGAYNCRMVDLPRLRTQRELILRLAASFGVTNVRVFGSVARGEARPDSDVDFLVSLPPSHSLLTWGAFWEALEAALGVKVDVVVESDLRPEVRQAILSEAIPL
jgi:predicted nucleotidyltransferase